MPPDAHSSPQAPTQCTLWRCGRQRRVTRTPTGAAGCTNPGPPRPAALTEAGSSRETCGLPSCFPRRGAERAAWRCTTSRRSRWCRPPRYGRARCRADRRAPPFSFPPPPFGLRAVRLPLMALRCGPGPGCSLRGRGTPCRRGTGACRASVRRQRALTALLRRDGS